MLFVSFERLDFIRSRITHTVDIVAVDASYDGPKINEETKKVDLPFVKSLVQHFKDQKKIHKKYAFMVILTCFFFSAWIRLSVYILTHLADCTGYS